MVREAVAKVHFKPEISLTGIANLFGILATLLSVVGTYFVLTYRVGQLEDTAKDAVSNKVVLATIQNDVRWIKTIIEKRAETPSSRAAVTRPTDVEVQ